MSRRRSHHVDVRGNTYDRMRRREWILRKFGNGRTVPCFHCHRRVRIFDIDRWPVTGAQGGRYTRDNIVPACMYCNRARGAASRAGRRAGRLVFRNQRWLALRND